jgi:peptidoglycan/xylan/chitin deacetylase (PgdA/CDA1 family)
MFLADRATLRRAFYAALRFTGEDARRMASHRESGVLTVLNLHRVSPDENPFSPPMKPEVFDDLLRFLTRECCVCSFGEAEELARRGYRDKPIVVLSFDDGYRDFIEHAMPLLASYGIRANQNVIVTSAETGRPPWIMLLGDFLLSAPPSLLRELRVPGLELELPGSDRVARARFAAKLSRHLKMRPRAERAPLMRPIEALMDRLGPFPATPMMTIQELRDISWIHDLGAHSCSHDSMGVETDAFFREDVAHCRRFFEEKLTLSLSTYAFPNGSHTPSQIEYLRANGIRRVLLVEEKLCSSAGPVYARIHMTGGSRSEARLVASGFRARGVL